jgi:plasmid stability protein
MKAITVRNVPADVAAALNQEKRRRGQSLNRTVIELLRQGLGVVAPRSNGLVHLAGGWSDERACEIERALAPFGDIDPEMWK